jgi:hypothetical protein
VLPEPAGARELRLPLETVIANVHEPSDFAGLPIVGADPAADGVPMAPPDRAVRLRRGGLGLLFLDELSSAPPAVAVLIDTSGSVSDAELGTALGEVAGITRASGVGANRVTVYSCGAAVRTAQRVCAAEQLTLVGGGGTDLRVGLRRALAATPRPDVVVALTDGFAPWPEAEPGVRVVAGLLGPAPHLDDEGRWQPGRPPPWAAVVRGRDAAMGRLTGASAAPCAAVPAGPARSVPVSPVSRPGGPSGGRPAVRGPGHHVRRPRSHLMIAPRAPVGLGRARTAHPAHHEVAVRVLLDTLPAHRRRRTGRRGVRGSAMTARHPAIIPNRRRSCARTDTP